MPTSPSYQKSTCCHGQDCSLLEWNDNEVCWGQVEPDSPGDGEDGRPIAGHLCRGHRHSWEYEKENVLFYYPENNHCH